MPNQSTSLLPHSSFELKDSDQIKRVLEAALLTTQDPLSLSEIKKLFDGKVSTEVLCKLLEELREKWVEGGIELVCVASGWRFHTKLEIQKFLNKLNPQKPPRYSRAVLETLAIIAYRQPVTRGDIEEIRGVSVSSPVLRVLEARGWIEVIGHRDVPGRPMLFATTNNFLDDLNLRSLEELPQLEEPGQLIDEKEELAMVSEKELTSQHEIHEELNLDNSG
ncbi:MAG: SMC-Scp complex subunit ScpB [Nitrosomonadaceae bacterium]|nr:SMC-Scp complex subunit ScpB [Nitrosomonadaceae bacterium]|tara:strand:+ start:459 stop:1121 length:663 start_codon:yes stop_codon:yes gene_type:complete